MHASRPAVTMKFIDLRRERPPLIQLLFDIVLYNASHEPRWFLLPAKLTPGSSPPTGGVNGVEVFSIGDVRRVVVGRFQGNAGFQAILLSPGAQIIMRRFPIALWEKIPDSSVFVSVVIARSFTVDGEPPKAWFDVDPLTDTLVEVSGQQSQRLGARYISDMREVPVAVIEDQRVEIEVSLH